MEMFPTEECETAMASQVEDPAPEATGDCPSVVDAASAEVEKDMLPYVNETDGPVGTAEPDSKKPRQEEPGRKGQRAKRQRGDRSTQIVDPKRHRRGPKDDADATESIADGTDAQLVDQLRVVATPLRGGDTAGVDSAPCLSGGESAGGAVSSAVEQEAVVAGASKLEGLQDRCRKAVVMKDFALAVKLRAEIRREEQMQAAIAKDVGPGPDSVTASFPVEEQRAAVAVQVDTCAQEAVQLAGALKHEVGTELQRQLQEMVSRNDFVGAGRVQAEIRRLEDTAAPSLAVGQGGAAPAVVGQGVVAPADAGPHRLVELQRQLQELVSKQDYTGAAAVQSEIELSLIHI